jgi:hypothetical protein
LAPKHLCRGVAQLVARRVRDAEASGSSPLTPTKIKQFDIINLFTGIGAVG